MVEREQDRSPKIGWLIETHDQHPEGFEAALIERQERWREVGSDEFTWSDCWALVRTLPYDSPLHREQDPKTWFWRNPMFDLVTSAVELLAVANVQRGNPSRASRSKFPKRIPRPWDQDSETTKLGGKIKLPVKDMLAWIESRRAKDDGTSG